MGGDFRDTRGYEIAPAPWWSNKCWRVDMFDGVKVFAVTKQKEREELGETATRWIQERRDQIEIVDKKVTQSSDSEYHCIALTIFYNHK